MAKIRGKSMENHVKIQGEKTDVGYSSGAKSCYVAIVIKGGVRGAKIHCDKFRGRGAWPLRGRKILPRGIYRAGVFRFGARFVSESKPAVCGERPSSLSVRVTWVLRLSHAG